MIKSFKDEVTEKIFNGEDLTQKELRKLGGLKIDKAQERLGQLDSADEKSLMAAPSLSYHALKGSGRYSIDTSRNSKWRITFEWDNEEKDERCACANRRYALNCNQK